MLKGPSVSTRWQTGALNYSTVNLCVGLFIITSDKEEMKCYFYVLSESISDCNWRWKPAGVAACYCLRFLKMLLPSSFSLLLWSTPPTLVHAVYNGLRSNHYYYINARCIAVCRDTTALFFQNVPFSNLDGLYFYICLLIVCSSTGGVYAAKIMSNLP